MKTIKWMIPPVILTVAFITAILAPLTGCGASSRERTLRATFVAVNAARDGFVAYDSAHQAKLVEDAKTLDEGKAAVAAYRHDREAVLSSFEGAYLLISAALLANDAKSLTTALEAASKLQKALDDMKKAKAKTKAESESP